MDLKYEYIEKQEDVRKQRHEIYILERQGINVYRLIKKIWIGLK